MLFKSTWNRKSKLVFLEQLEMYISSGLSISKALHILSERSSKEQGRDLDRAQRAIESGQTLSSSLRSEIKLSPAITGLIACGESSGNLAGTLRSGHALLSREDELVRKCSGAMVYPLIIGLATAGLTVGLVKGIMPQITPLLLSLRSDLPLITKIVMNVSEALTSYGLHGLVGLLLLAFLSVSAYRRSPTFRCSIHRCAMHTPLVGRMVTDYHLALFFQSLGASVESGMPLDGAFEKTTSSVSLLPLRRQLEAKTPAVGHGESISQLLDRTVPSYVTALVAVGEVSGHLGAALLRVAYLIDRELDHFLKRLTALIEPAMMMAMGVLVGSVALSIMMPIYDISRAIQK